MELNRETDDDDDDNEENEADGDDGVLDFLSRVKLCSMALKSLDLEDSFLVTLLSALV